MGCVADAETHEAVAQGCVRSINFVKGAVSTETLPDVRLASDV